MTTFLSTGLLGIFLLIIIFFVVAAIWFDKKEKGEAHATLLYQERCSIKKVNEGMWVANMGYMPIWRISFYNSHLVLASLATHTVIRYKDVTKVNDQRELIGGTIELRLCTEPSMKIRISTEHPDKMIEILREKTNAVFSKSKKWRLW
jgi:Mn2+/Fe2+ NRAMP family transporter